MDGAIDSLIHTFLNNAYNVDNVAWNRSHRKLQTKENHHPKQLDEIGNMVLSTASFMHCSNKVYSKFRPILEQVETQFRRDLDNK